MNDVDKNDTCPMCSTKIVGLSWTREISVGTKTIESAQKKFGMTYDEVCSHLDTHERLTLEEGGEDPSDLNLGKLLKSIRIIDDMIDEVRTMEGEKAINVAKALTSLTKELRENLKALSDLQIRLATSTSLMKSSNTESTVLGIINMIDKEACPECKKKISLCINQNL